MERIFILKNAARSILIVGMVCGMAAVVHAQPHGGPGQVGGMGQGGAPAGEFPSDPGSATFNRNMQIVPTPEPDLPAKKGSSKDSSPGQRPAPIKQDSGAGLSTSEGSSSGSSSPGAPSESGGY